MTSLPQNSGDNQNSPQKPLTRKQRNRLKRQAKKQRQREARAVKKTEKNPSPPLKPKKETLKTFLKDRGALESLGGGYSAINLERLTESEKEIATDGLMAILFGDLA